MKTIRVRDLPQSPAHGVCLYCPECGDQWSATAGDYFMAPLETVMRCGNDKTRLQLVRVSTRIEAYHGD